MRVYEELFIMKPDAPEEDVDAYIEQVKALIITGKGTVDKVDKWGTRKLAYRVSKFSEGIYVLVVFTSGPELVREVERRMRVTDMVIKFITVRIDEKQKKIAKRKLARDKRAARRPAPQPAMMPSAPAPAAPAAEHAVPGAPGSHPAPAAPAAVSTESPAAVSTESPAAVSTEPPAAPAEPVAPAAPAEGGKE
jgi:small subunit ribosomal protein S6